MLEAYYNDEYGVLLIKYGDNSPNNIVVHNLKSVIDAWQELFARGYDCSGFVRVNLGEELGEAMQATDLEYTGRTGGTP